MNPMKKAAIAGVAGLSLAGGSLAVAAVSPLGIAGAQEDGTEQSEDRRASGLVDILTELVDDGTLTQAQADAVAERVEERMDERRAEFEARHAEIRAEREAFAEELAAAAGVTADEMQEARQNGDSLADIAGDNVDAVIDLLVEQQTERINDAAASGRIDQERADEALAGVEDRVTEMVNREGFGPGGFRGRGGFGDHGPRGFGPGGFGDTAPADEPAVDA